jgi:hypothetical protein
METIQYSMETAKMIQKEEIIHVKFVSYEVLETLEQKKNRRELIEEAMILGNGEKGKSKIYFMSEEGLMEVETTVWSASDDIITLKGGIMIPVHCVTKVELI